MIEEGSMDHWLGEGRVHWGRWTGGMVARWPVYCTSYSGSMFIPKLELSQILSFLKFWKNQL